MKEVGKVNGGPVAVPRLLVAWGISSDWWDLLLLQDLTMMDRVPRHRWSGAQLPGPCTVSGRGNDRYQIVPPRPGASLARGGVWNPAVVLSSSI